MKNATRWEIRLKAPVVVRACLPRTTFLKYKYKSSANANCRYRYIVEKKEKKNVRSGRGLGRIDILELFARRPISSPPEGEPVVYSSSRSSPADDLARVFLIDTSPALGSGAVAGPPTSVFNQRVGKHVVEFVLKMKMKSFHEIKLRKLTR